MSVAILKTKKTSFLKMATGSNFKHAQTTSNFIFGENFPPAATFSHETEIEEISQIIQELVLEQRERKVRKR